jgi:hypothetical protein
MTTTTSTDDADAPPVPPLEARVLRVYWWSGSEGASRVIRKLVRRDDGTQTVGAWMYDCFLHHATEDVWQALQSQEASNHHDERRRIHIVCDTQHCVTLEPVRGLSHLQVLTKEEEEEEDNASVVEGNTLEAQLMDATGTIWDAHDSIWEHVMAADDAVQVQVRPLRRRRTLAPPQKRLRIGLPHGLPEQAVPERFRPPAPRWPPRELPVTPLLHHVPPEENGPLQESATVTTRMESAETVDRGPVVATDPASHPPTNDTAHREAAESSARRSTILEAPPTEGIASPVDPAMASFPEVDAASKAASSFSSGSASSATMSKSSSSTKSKASSSTKSKASSSAKSKSSSSSNSGSSSSSEEEEEEDANPGVVAPPPTNGPLANGQKRKPLLPPDREIIIAARPRS